MNKREMAGLIVGEFAGHKDDAPQKPYTIRLVGKFFCAAETDELADKVAEAFDKPTLTGLVESIPE